VMTIAPECPRDRSHYSSGERGVCVSLGHSDADLNAARAGVVAVPATPPHFQRYAALDHRDPGILGEVLTDSRLSADIIADGIHLDRRSSTYSSRQRGRTQRVITDATAATGMRDGRYRLGSLEVEVKDGKCMSGGIWQAVC